MSWILWAMLAACFAGLTAILAKLGVRDIDSDLATAIRTLVILVLSWTIVIVRGTKGLEHLSGRTLTFLVLSGLATGASWLCYFRALQLGDASKVAPIDKLSVVITMILATCLLGESLNAKQLLGGALIVTGAVILARS